jgi:RHS repeat-associated protein
MSLLYDAPTAGTAQYNGNISEMQWRSNAASCGTLNAYRLNYDRGNRLLNANHWTQTGAVWANTDNYSENNISYDLNGNIKTLNRRGATTNTSTFGNIDLLSYTYNAANPDKLLQIADGSGQTKGFKKTNASANYGYDANGNMTQDNNKVLGITYNHLNLPTTFTVNGSLITMTYTADGEKLAKVAGANTKNYVSGIEYKGAALEAIYTSEGRCTPNGATAFFYEYTIKDHLGNARVSFRAGTGAVLSVIQENHYYAFGMEMEGTWAATTGVKNNYEYNGKELNEDFGLNLSDYGARWYDAAVGRWWSVDPLAEKFASKTSYNYGLNNPIIMIDPDGMESEAANFGTGSSADMVEKLKGQMEAQKFAQILGGIGKISTRARYEAKFQRKIGDKLQAMANSGAASADIKNEANELANKYQNKKWFRFFANNNGNEGERPNKHIAGTKNESRNSTSTGWAAKHTISINPFPVSMVSFAGVRRNGNTVMNPNNSPISTGITVLPGAQVSASFSPYTQPDGLSVDAGGINITNSGGQVVAPNNNENQVFTLSGVFSGLNPQAMTIQVNNTMETPNLPDTWNLNITVQQPFTVDPYLIVKTNVTYFQPNKD